MELNATTGYAIRVLIHLERKNRKVSGTKISEATGISPKYLLKLMGKLRRGGLVDSEPGSSGGYFLRKGLEQITFHDVVNITEPVVRISKCVEDIGCCSMGADSNCSIRNFYLDMEQDIRKRWLCRTLKEISQWPAAGNAAAGTCAHERKSRREESIRSEVGEKCENCASM